MSDERLFLDTSFVQALLSRRDQYHIRAKTLLPRVQSAAEVWITEAVLVELGNALSAFDRSAAAQFIDQCYHTPNIRVVAIDTNLFRRAVELYRTRVDKEWGLTDCISFILMRDEHLHDALTADHHFSQAGFRAIMGDG